MNNFSLYIFPFVSTLKQLETASDKPTQQFSSTANITIRTTAIIIFANYTKIPTTLF